MFRWIVPLAGFLLTLMGGISYAWGVFVVPITERFGWTKAEATLPFTVFFATFALMMVPGGLLQDKTSPRKVAVIGAALFFVSYGLASLVGFFPYPWWLVATYGVIGGMACGLTYACAVPPARKWFPDKPGLAVSFAVMGFGLAALVLAPLKANYLIPVYGIEATFFVIAIATSAVSLLSALAIKNPPEGWVPLGWNPVEKRNKRIEIRGESTPREVLKNPVFLLIWSTFALTVSGGFIFLGLIPTYGEIILGLAPAEAALAIAIFAFVNGFGRPVAGFLSDRFGVLWVMIATYIIQTATLLFFPVFAVTLPELYAAAVFLGWGFATTLALFPVLTSICFGTKHLGINYGLVFTAFGVGALVPAIGSWIFDITGSFTPVFICTGIMSGMGLVISLALKKKHLLP